MISHRSRTNKKSNQCQCDCLRCENFTAGGELGALLEVTSFMEKCRRRFKPLKVVFTGGDADFFVKSIKTKIFANPNLVLIGLKLAEDGT